MSESVSCGGGVRDPVKIVLIDTQYVETDETNFKSVVQELTGKNSGNHQISPTKSRKERPYSKMKMEEGNNSAFTRDSSFKEYDRLMKEMPNDNDYYTMIYGLIDGS